MGEWAGSGDAGTAGSAGNRQEPRNAGGSWHPFSFGQPYRPNAPKTTGQPTGVAILAQVTGAKGPLWEDGNLMGCNGSTAFDGCHAGSVGFQA